MPPIKCFVVNFKANLNPEGKEWWGECLALFMLSQKKGSLLLKRPDLKCSEPPSAANISYAIPFDDWYKFMKIHGGDFPGNPPGQRMKGNRGSGQKAGAGSCQVRDRGQLCAGCLHHPHKCRSQLIRIWEWGAVGTSPAGNQITRKSPIQFTPLNNFVSV